MTKNIQFNFTSKISLAERNKLKAFIFLIFKKEKKKPGNISYVFCSDKEILQINRSYLQHNYYTDIITFDLSQPGSPIIDAEIYISTDTVRDNAIRFKNSIKKELHRVIFHGILHLCGYKDKTPADQELMTKKENYYLELYF